MRVPYVDLATQHQLIKEELKDAFCRVIDHGKFVHGPEVEEIEQSLAAFLGVRNVVGVNSGTDALILALKAHGIGAGDEVITPSHSFVATALAISMVGATPVFVDVCADTMVLDPEKLSACLTQRTKAVIPVHLNGYACDMAAIDQFCKAHQLALIEDCAQAIGSQFQGQTVGSLGIGCFSLHPLKILNACGDAGFITTNDDELAQLFRQMRNLGLKDRNNCVMVSGNSRLDSIQAAILLVKMKHLNEWLTRRREVATAYQARLSDQYQLPPKAEGQRSNHSAFVVRHPKRDQLQAYLKEAGISSKIHYPLAIHQQDPFLDCRKDDLSVTEAVVQTCLSIPSHSWLTDDMVDYVIEKLNNFVGV